MKCSQLMTALSSYCWVELAEYRCSYLRYLDLSRFSIKTVATVETLMMEYYRYSLGMASVKKFVQLED